MTLSEVVKAALIGKEISVKKYHKSHEFYEVENVTEPDNNDGWQGAYVQIFQLLLDERACYDRLVRIGMDDEIEIRSKRRPVSDDF